MLLASIFAACTHFDGLRVVHSTAVFLESVEVLVVVACASALTEQVF